MDVHIEKAVSRMQSVIELGRGIRDRKVLPNKVVIVMYYILGPKHKVSVGTRNAMLAIKSFIYGVLKLVYRTALFDMVHC